MGVSGVRTMLRKFFTKNSPVIEELLAEEVLTRRPKVVIDEGPEMSIAFPCEGAKAINSAFSPHVVEPIGSHRTKEEGIVIKS